MAAGFDNLRLRRRQTAVVSLIKKNSTVDVDYAKSDHEETPSIKQMALNTAELLRSFGAGDPPRVKPKRDWSLHIRQLRKHTAG